MQKGLLLQNLLSVDDIDALLHLAYALAGKVIEHNSGINQDWHLNADGHREEEYSVLDYKETDHVGKDA